MMGVLVDRGAVESRERLVELSGCIENVGFGMGFFRFNEMGVVGWTLV
jgi:hypothetical protein